MHPFLLAPRMHVPDHPFLEMNPLWFGPFDARYRHVWGHWFTPTYETSCTLWKKLHTYIYETSCLLHMHRRKAMINDHQPLLEFNSFWWDLAWVIWRQWKSLCAVWCLFWFSFSLLLLWQQSRPKSSIGEKTCQRWLASGIGLKAKWREPLFWRFANLNWCNFCTFPNKQRNKRIQFLTLFWGHKSEKSTQPVNPEEL